MKFDFKKAAEAIVPSLQNSWKHAVAGAGVCAITFDVGSMIGGAIVGGLANAGVEVFKAGTAGAPTSRPG